MTPKGDEEGRLKSLYTNGSMDAAEYVDPKFETRRNDDSSDTIDIGRTFRGGIDMDFGGRRLARFCIRKLQTFFT